MKESRARGCATPSSCPRGSHRLVHGCGGYQDTDDSLPCIIVCPSIEPRSAGVRPGFGHMPFEKAGSADGRVAQQNSTGEPDLLGPWQRVEQAAVDVAVPHLQLAAARKAHAANGFDDCRTVVHEGVAEDIRSSGPGAERGQMKAILVLVRPWCQDHEHAVAL